MCTKSESPRLQRSCFFFFCQVQTTPRCCISHRGCTEAQGSRQDPGPRNTSGTRWKVCQWEGHHVLRVRAWRTGLRTSKQQKSAVLEYGRVSLEILRVIPNLLKGVCVRGQHMSSTRESSSQKVKMTGHFGKYKYVFMVSWDHPPLVLQPLLQLVTIFPHLTEDAHTQSSHWPCHDLEGFNLTIAPISHCKEYKNRRQPHV